MYHLPSAEDLNSFNRALDACSGARRWEEALCLVQEMGGAHSGMEAGAENVGSDG